MRSFEWPASTVALAAALAAALVLGGCGRKSGLDLPPSASAGGSPTTQAPAPGSTSEILPFHRQPRPKEPEPPKRSLPIDVLLN